MLKTISVSKNPFATSELDLFVDLQIVMLIYKCRTVRSKQAPLQGLTFLLRRLTFLQQINLNIMDQARLGFAEVCLKLIPSSYHLVCQLDVYVASLLSNLQKREQSHWNRCRSNWTKGGNGFLWQNQSSRVLFYSRQPSKFRTCCSLHNEHRATCSLHSPCRVLYVHLLLLHRATT